MSDTQPATETGEQRLWAVLLEHTDRETYDGGENCLFDQAQKGLGLTISCLPDFDVAFHLHAPVNLCTDIYFGVANPPYVHDYDAAMGYAHQVLFGEPRP